MEVLQAQKVSGVPRQDGMRSQFHGRAEEENQEASWEGSVLQLWAPQDEWWRGQERRGHALGVADVPRRQEREHWIQAACIQIPALLLMVTSGDFLTCLSVKRIKLFPPEK